MLDSKLKKSFKRGKQYIDLPPSVDMETRYAPPKPKQVFGQVKEKLHGQKLRPMARIKYEIDIIVSRQRFGSMLLPNKRGERIILAFAVEPYPPRTAGLAVPTLEPIRARRTASRDNRSPSVDRQATTSDAASVNSGEAEEDETVDEDSWLPIWEVSDPRRRCLALFLVKKPTLLHLSTGLAHRLQGQISRVLVARATSMSRRALMGG